MLIFASNLFWCSTRQGCRLVSTEDIPYLGSLTRKAAHEAASSDARPQVVGRDVDGSVPLFDPGVVELNATMLLRFLQVRHTAFVSYSQQHRPDAPGNGVDVYV